MSKFQWKAIVTVVVLGLAAYFIYPTIEWYRMPQSEREQLEKNKDKMVERFSISALI